MKVPSRHLSIHPSHLLCPRQGIGVAGAEEEIATWRIGPACKDGDRLVPVCEGSRAKLSEEDAAKLRVGYLFLKVRIAPER